MNKQLLFVLALVLAGCGGAVSSASSGPEAAAKGVEQVATSSEQKRGTLVNRMAMDEQAVPPAGLGADEVPLFVGLGFDDNGMAEVVDDEPEGMNWVLDMLGNRKNPDGSGMSASFYMTSSYAVGEKNDYGDAVEQSPTLVKQMWHRAYLEGHEIGNHTHTHPHGTRLSVDAWVKEMTRCNQLLTASFDEHENPAIPNPESGAGIPAAEIVGFRTPFLEYNDNMFTAATQMGFAYDCSIEDGLPGDQDGTNYFWPYTLDNGSRSHDLQVSWGQRAPISNYPGLIEMPVYAVIVPPDDLCEKYGVAVGFRDRMKKAADYFDVKDGKITGFDYNLWVLFHMTGEEFLATLKYTFDLRKKGNRAPFLFGMHSDIYAAGYDEESEMRARPKERRSAVEAFVDYVVTFEATRVVATRDVMRWMESPTPL